MVPWKHGTIRYLRFWHNQNLLSTLIFFIAELVHITKYKEVEEAMAKRKLRMIDGKPVATTGPWQMIDIPTKVYSIFKLKYFNSFI